LAVSEAVLRDEGTKAAAPPADEQPAPETVAGERGIGSINRVRSLQSRVSNLLAIGLMSALGIGLLGWYYVRTYSNQANARETAQSASRGKARGEMPLPPLGRIDPPTVVSSDQGLAAVLGPEPEEPPPEDIPEAWLRPAEDPPVGYAAQPRGKSPEQIALERKLSGPAYSRHGDSSSSATPSASSPSAGASVAWSPETGAPMSAGSTPGAALDGLLKPSTTPAALARVLPTQRLLLPKGAFIDCTLETAIDSSLPGMTTCVTATDTFGVDGSTVLLERGSKLVGETKGEVQQGSARIFVLWSEARTPTGVIIPLASPGTDELGRSGLQGKVNRHFFERFGAAILISVIDGVVQGAAQSSGDGNSVVYNPSTSSDVMTEVLKSTVNIRPTVTKRNGDRIQVLVARDLDFRSVYELKPTARAR
jgi:type IV secretion system protein VirB10